MVFIPDGSSTQFTDHFGEHSTIDCFKRFWKHRFIPWHIQKSEYFSLSHATVNSFIFFIFLSKVINGGFSYFMVLRKFKNWINSNESGWILINSILLHIRRFFAHFFITILWCCNLQLFTIFYSCTNSNLWYFNKQHNAKKRLKHNKQHNAIFFHSSFKNVIQLIIDIRCDERTHYINSKAVLKLEVWVFISFWQLNFVSDIFSPMSM